MHLYRNFWPYEFAPTEQPVVRECSPLSVACEFLWRFIRQSYLNYNGKQTNLAADSPKVYFLRVGVGVFGASAGFEGALRIQLRDFRSEVK